MYLKWPFTNWASKLNSNRMLARPLLAFLALSWCCGTLPALAAVTWLGDVDPNDPTAWTSNTLGFVGKTGLGTLEITAGDTLPESHWVSIGHQDNGVGQVTVEGIGSSLTSALFYVGYDGNGRLDITSGASVTTNGGSNIGMSVGSVGVVAVDGVGSMWTSFSHHVGHSGTGTLNITHGGAVTNDQNGIVGYNRDSTGIATVDGSGSTWTINKKLQIGRAGNGTLNITGGGVVVVGEETWVASSGEIHFDNGTLTTESLFANFQDFSGTGTVNVQGMISDVALVFDATQGLIQTFVVNDNPNQNVTVNLEISSASRNLGAGYTGAGTLSISDGVAVPTIKGTVGYRAGSMGQVTVEGTGSTWTQSQYLYVGYEGSGTLSITESGFVDSRWAHIGSKAGSSGEVTVAGAGSAWTTASLSVGRAGEGTLNIIGSGTVDSNIAMIGYTSGSIGQVNVSGLGSIWTVGSLYVGFNNESGSSLLEITDGGQVRVDGKLNIDFYDQNGSDFINLSTGGMLAIIGDADDSLAQFLGLLGGSDAIRYWDDITSDWANLVDATLGDDYTLSYQAAGNLNGYTLLTVGSIPQAMISLGDGSSNDVARRTDNVASKSTFGNTSESREVTTVPEPSSLVLLLFSMVGFLFARR